MRRCGGAYGRRLSREGTTTLRGGTGNSFKRTQIMARDPLHGRRVRLFNPRRQRWARHFQWSEDGTRILGRTACGRATVIALQLNHVMAVMVRREWVAAGWHPPED